MSTTSQPLAEAESAVQSNPQRAEALYKQILESPPSKSTGEDAQADQAAILRDQETALVNLGKLYRDQKSVDLTWEAIQILIYVVGMLQDSQKLSRSQELSCPRPRKQRQPNSVS